MSILPVGSLPSVLSYEPNTASSTPEPPQSASNGPRTTQRNSTSSWRVHQAPSLRRTVSSTLVESRRDMRTVVLSAVKAGSKFLTHTGRAFASLSVPQRILVTTVGVLLAAIVAVTLAYSHKIFVWLRPAADHWRQLPFGWVIVLLVSTVTAFPPLMGYSTVVAISGFLYGCPGGWPVVAAGNVIGSTLSLILCRTVFSNYVHRLIGEDKRFVALGQVLRKEGLGMLTMIRLCPLPYSLSNGFLAQVPTIRPWMYALATGLSSPKLFVHVFIGSRLALFADEGDKMSAGDKVINYLFMALSALVAGVVGWLVYQRTMARAAELAVETEGTEGEQVLEFLHDVGIDPNVNDSLEAGDNVFAVEDDDISSWGDDSPTRYLDDSVTH